MLNAPYEDGIVEVNREIMMNAACEGEPVVGYDNRLEENRWWVVLNGDIEVALIER